LRGDVHRHADGTGNALHDLGEVAVALSGGSSENTAPEAARAM